MATQAPAKTITQRTITLSKRLKRTHGPRRIGIAVRHIREDVARHSKTSPGMVSIGAELNRYLLLGSAQGFYGVKVTIEKTGQEVTVDLTDKKKKVEPKKEEKKAEDKKTEAAKKENAKKAEAPAKKPATKEANPKTKPEKPEAAQAPKV